MANEYSVNQSDLLAIADTIREKTGGSDSLMFPDGFVSAMDNLALSKNLYFFLDEKFTLVDTIFPGDSVVFTLDKLKELPDYHALIIEKTTATTISNAIYLLSELKLGSGDYSWLFSQGTPVRGSGITIDNGSITIKTVNQQLQAGEYHLYIICNKEE